MSESEFELAQTPSSTVWNRALLLPRVWGETWALWWQSKTLNRKVMPAALVLVYWGTVWKLGGFRGDHVFLGTALLVLSYAGEKTEILLRFLLPLALTGIVWDSQRFFGDYIRGPVHVAEPYFLEKKLFGISTVQGVLTPNEWFQTRTHPLIDLVTGFAYLVFFSAFTLIAAYYRFWLGRVGTLQYSAAYIRGKAMNMMWAFFWLNVVGFATYYVYAAAPPWYVALHGLGPAKMDTPGNPAGCIRFDEILGTNFFTGMYGRAADVFAAIPSLHVAYPFLAVIFAFKLRVGRAFNVFFYLLMCFSAVYLNHHYILDILLGTFYALVIGVLFVRDRNDELAQDRPALKARFEDGKVGQLY